MFENDVKMYGIQTISPSTDSWNSFENDVKMYGIQTARYIAKYNYKFENDVKMYGIQTILIPINYYFLFENDVKMYGIQTVLMLLLIQLLFENDVKMYGIQTYELKSTLHNEMIRRGISMDFKYCKLEIFLPPSHLEVLQKALQKVDAGHIGNYDSCMSVSSVTGYWRPLDGCNPYIGTNGEISCEPELKVEVTVYTENVDKTIEVVKSVHPYEEPVINVIPLWRTSF